MKGSVMTMYALSTPCATPLVVRLTLLLLTTLCLGGCGGEANQKQVQGPRQLTPKNESEQSFDLNGDLKPDVWRHYTQKGKDKILSHKVFDLNFDGRPDFKRVYTEAGKVVRDELDMDFDGTFDRIIYYKDNRLERKEVSLQGDKRPEVFKYYNKKGKLYYLEGDRDADSVLDYWEYYRDGKLARRGHDRNKDGKPDSWDELD